MNAPQYAADPDVSFDSYAEFYRESAYSQSTQQHRAGGSFGVSVLKSEQEPIDFIDAPVPEIVFCRPDTDGREVLLDIGDGVVRSPFRRGSFTVYPANTTCRTRVIDAHKITYLTLPVNKISDEMHKAGVSGDCGVFGRWISRNAPMPLSASRLMDRMWSILHSPRVPTPSRSSPLAMRHASAAPSKGL